ncbi:hypothetical protein [Flavobacterium sp. ZB4R12]|uniref:hypothetical protein n=1 Tax=Flavobacterium sp. ZB4R12 TaxID=3398732 RepID=UPI003AABD1A4
MNNSLHSDEYNRRNENFEIGLIELDEKHIEYFKPRPPRFFSQKHDHIVNHFMIINTGINPAIKIISNELPKEIMDDLLNLFHQHWD